VSPALSPTSELNAAVAFVNTYDELNDPKDGLTSIDVLHRVLQRCELGSVAQGLTARDLNAARRLRHSLRQVFVASDDSARATVLNGLLRSARSELELRPGQTGWELAGHSARGGIGPLTATFATALARVIADGAGDRLGVCAAHPCRCVFVDATRSRRQRYCCELCNDRVAAAAYRRRTANRRP
jgi:predicted RNA-binding Zn ribbon-like protein